MLKFPSLDKEGKQRPQTATGVVRTAGEELHQQRDSSKSHHPRGAAPHIPSSVEEGSFRAIFRVSRQKLVRRN